MLDHDHLRINTEKAVVQCLGSLGILRIIQPSGSSTSSTATEVQAYENRHHLEFATAFATCDKDRYMFDMFEKTAIYNGTYWHHSYPEGLAICWEIAELNVGFLEWNIIYE
jgi:hypothetical protein